MEASLGILLPIRLTEGTLPEESAWVKREALFSAQLRLDKGICYW